jgi:hypothetical protein
LWRFCCSYMKASSGVNVSASLYHDLIDIPLQNMEKYKRERAVVHAAERHDDVSQLIIEKPRPPAFGPLIRLYILADRLNIDWRLKAAICGRAARGG